MRKEFSVKGPVSEARLYISSQGLYQAEINGKRVGNQEFTPGWTSYNKRIQYQTYDITDYLRVSDNAIGILLGDGWYRGYLGWGNNRNVYGQKLAVIAQIRIKYNDGTIAYIATDESWKSSTGPILKSDIYNGETYDARLEQAGWSLPGFDDKGWKGTKITGNTKGNPDCTAGTSGIKDTGTETGKDFKNRQQFLPGGYGPEHGRMGQHKSHRNSRRQNNNETR